ncbi:hypothetical protein FRB93_007995 [Tulasnella sp. JGI-2019a]|nr:hypothetical protein FRB93_007995 [Tulasnella sp. JGI-2019a]
MREQHDSIFVQIENHPLASAIPFDTQLPDDDDNVPKLVTVSHLPAETLVQIIHIASHPRGNRRSHDYIKRLHAFAQVCSAWANVIRQTPSFWSLVHYDAQFGGSEWLMALKRSRSSPIAVEFVNRAQTTNDPFWSTIKPHSHRWLSLVIRTREKRDHWIDFHGVCAPLLDDLRINISNLARELTISRENFPAVSTLTLINVGLRDWDSGLLSGLRHLHLSSIPDDPPSLLQLLNMLAASPCLEHLDMSWVEPAVNGTFVRRPPIPLPNLRYLRFDEFPVTVIDIILQSVQATYCPIISIDLDAPEESSYLFPAVTSFLTPSLYHFSATASEAITLLLGTDAYKFIIDGDRDTDYKEPGVQASIAPSPNNLDVIVDWLDGLLVSQPPGLQHLRLGIGFKEQRILD